jgi:hypothetical protein
MHLTIGLSNDSVGFAGGFTSDFRNQWYFISATQRGNSRKGRDTVEAAIPKGFTGYIVDAVGRTEAIQLTEGYRAGREWAVDAAADGLIRIVRKGRVQD